MEDDVRKKRNARWGLILLLLLALVIAAIFVIRGYNAADEVKVAIYYEGNPDIGDGAAVLFHKEVVGGIEKIEGGIRCLQLIVRHEGDEDRLEAATIAIDSTISVGDSATGSYRIFYDGDLVTIAPARSGDAIARIRRYATDNAWCIARNGDVPIMLNDKPIDTGCVMLMPSDEIGLGALRLRWNDPGIYARVEVTLDTGDISALAHLPAAPVSATLATLSTGFGLARPGIRLTLPPVGMGRTLVRGGMMEMVPQQDFDLYAVVNKVGGYLTSSERIFSPPRNRVERAVNDVNLLLDRVANISRDVNAITTDFGDPNYDGRPATTRTGRMADALLADIEIATAKLNGLVDNTNGTVTIFRDRTMPNLEASADTLVTEVGETLFQLNKGLREMRLLTERLRTGTIPRVETTLDGTTEDARSTLRKIDMTAQEVENAARRLRQVLR